MTTKSVTNHAPTVTRKIAWNLATRVGTLIGQFPAASPLSRRATGVTIYPSWPTPSSRWKKPMSISSSLSRRATFREHQGQKSSSHRAR